MAKYGNDSLDLLIGAKRIRTRPASMLGSSGIDGARHGFTEIYGNALDEASSGCYIIIHFCHLFNLTISIIII